MTDFETQMLSTVKEMQKKLNSLCVDVGCSSIVIIVFGILFLIRGCNALR